MSVVVLAVEPKADIVSASLAVPSFAIDDYNSMIYDALINILFLPFND